MSVAFASSFTRTSSVSSSRIARACSSTAFSSFAGWAMTAPYASTALSNCRVAARYCALSNGDSFIASRRFSMSW